ncbi:hypothetical protein [Glycomyces artemisiae]|uniref:Uncharacterized protein n=1 Tax=Glycomyces artemisiae TaxID=1076443 RepID=A0A2T0UXA2_9ACTN|nr:hypothetical protein [Glycomyces artemisiae]PRY62559.1 hypothetical protein B0I28_101893 [Glycomyces artemisiae]
MELTRRNVENVVESMDVAMRTLREAMVGMPDKEMGFKRAHENAARDAAHFMVLLTETAGHR